MVKISGGIYYAGYGDISYGRQLFLDAQPRLQGTSGNSEASCVFSGSQRGVNSDHQAVRVAQINFFNGLPEIQGMDWIG